MGHEELLRKITAGLIDIAGAPLKPHLSVNVLIECQRQRAIDLIQFIQDNHKPT